MKPTSAPIQHIPSEGVRGSLINLGFTREGRWWLLHLELEQNSPALGSPGLWCSVPNQKSSSSVFAIHDTTLSFAQDDPAFDEAESHFTLADAIHAWALATAAGAKPADWQAPPRQEVEALIPREKLTILTGQVARQGELICTSDRIALRFPIVPSFPSDLPEFRHRLLSQVLSEAQSHWRLVRFGLARTPDAMSILTEVDLTGAPRQILEPLLSSSLDALRNAVTWIVETAMLLTDASAAIRSLEYGPQPQPKTVKETNT